MMNEKENVMILEVSGWSIVVPASLELTPDDLRDEDFLEELLESAVAGEEGFRVLYRPGDIFARSEPYLDRG